MVAIAQELLQFILETKDKERVSWDEFPAPVWAFISFVYNGGIWDHSFREKLSALKTMKVSDMCLDDVFAYFTAIVAIERSFNGFVEQNAYDGTLEALLHRYLELVKEGE